MFTGVAGVVSRSWRPVATTAVWGLLAALVLGGYQVVVAAAPAQAAVQSCPADAGFTDCVRFTSSGADQSFTVPAGVTSLNIKAWGAGGGGIDSRYYASQAGGAGGGFARGTATVTPGATLRVVAGVGGKNGSAGSTTAT